MGSCASKENIDIAVDLIALLPDILDRIPKNNEERLMKINHHYARKKDLNQTQKALLKYVQRKEEEFEKKDHPANIADEHD